ncbi:hypothetical protein AQUCO_04900156v1 [Aquilegia coerulea]|uniref:Uncharacterized protein n=1 Tax=Aquilegia coerulea TaxID=218851 RepID=A0A2G5CK67_AQUCA|nr:hypothetical protein AQUCO_04900156v1 [Aquilegia coerulea]
MSRFLDPYTKLSSYASSNGYFHSPHNSTSQSVAPDFQSCHAMCPHLVKFVSRNWVMMNRSSWERQVSNCYIKYLLYFSENV